MRGRIFSRLEFENAPLPREHGAWAMFAVPLLVGMGTAGHVNPAVVLFALTAFGLFMLRYPLMLAVKARNPRVRENALVWSAVYALPTGATGLALLLVSAEWRLLAIAFVGVVALAIHLWSAAHRAEMSTLGEWVGIAGLAIGAPGAYLLATGALDLTALALYVLNTLYFGGTVFYVKFKVREQPRLPHSQSNWVAHLWAGRVTLAYHVFAILAVAAFALQGWVPALAVIAFVPMECKAVGGVLSRPARLNIRHLGFIELGLTILFAAVVLLAYRLAA